MLGLGFIISSLLFIRKIIIMEKIYKNRKLVSITLSVFLSVFVVAAAVNATTIGTAITTTGLSSLNGNASTTILSTTGNIMVNGFATTTGSNGNIATQGTLSVLGSASSTSLIVGGDSDNGTLSGLVFGTCTYTPGGAITASSTRVSSCTGANGVRVGDKVFVTPRSLENNLIFVSASSTTAGAISVSVYNTGATGNITPGSQTWYWMAIR